MQLHFAPRMAQKSVKYNPASSHTCTPAPSHQIETPELSRQFDSHQRTNPRSKGVDRDVVGPYGMGPKGPLQGPHCSEARLQPAAQQP